jgi:hypothetical protein
MAAGLKPEFLTEGPQRSQRLLVQLFVGKSLATISNLDRLTPQATGMETMKRLLLTG